MSDYGTLIDRADSLPEGHPDLPELAERIRRARLGLRTDHEVETRRIDTGVLARVQVLQETRRWKDLMALTDRAIQIEEQRRMEEGLPSPTALCHILVRAHNAALDAR